MYSILPNFNNDLARLYYDAFGDYDYGIPTLPNEQATIEFYEKAIQWCISNNKPMEVYWKETYPKEYAEYHQLMQDGCLL